MGYRAKAKSLGAEIRPDEVTEILRSQDRIEGVRLKSGAELKAGGVVNAAGAWAGAVARTAGVDLPIAPIQRQVFAFKPATPVGESLPLIIYPSDLYFRPETGGLILVGKSLKEDPVTFDLSWQKERFEEIIWPELARVVPSFESLKLVRGWAGLYETNLLDQNGIIGLWPELKGFYLINGFSGHGVQQAPAAGRHLGGAHLRQNAFFRPLPPRPAADSGRTPFAGRGGRLKNHFLFRPNFWTSFPICSESLRKKFS